jgi:ATP phosphoribosyltransferase
MLRMALPNKGMLAEGAVELVREAGYWCRRLDGKLVLRDVENEVEFVFLRPRDIALYVGSGVLDLGITGRDFVVDSEARVVELLELDFGHSAFYYAVPSDSGLTVGDFVGRRIATSFANVVRRDLQRRKVEAQVVRLDGAVEISVALGVADAVADVVQTGRTLEQAGLVKVGEPVMESEAVLVGRDASVIGKPSIERVLKRLRGIVLARQYVMVEYDVAHELVDAACRITPGIGAPTVMPLSKQGWVAIKAMVVRRQTNSIMDQLQEMGATGIVVTDIRTCRI